jgi:integrase
VVQELGEDGVQVISRADQLVIDATAGAAAADLDQVVSYRATATGRSVTEAYAALRAAKAAKVADAHFHDIRGKAATDAKRDGLDYQAMLGHSTKRMSDRYIHGKESVRVEPMRRAL